MTEKTVPSFPAFDPMGGWARTMALEFVRISGEEVVVEWTVGPQHLQPFGIVHGGVHSGVVETICSVGAGTVAATRGQTVVGVENHTSFIRAVREGRLRGVAKPLHVGQRAMLWEATITDAGGRLVASGRVRLFCLDPGESSGKPAR
ncbi:MAG TPA: PaaI family thioesterase [Polyangiaceae bacterium]|nr:PaaI family thioesterase [Polyangiaceae bacterium]